MVRWVFADTFFRRSCVLSRSRGSARLLYLQYVVHPCFARGRNHFRRMISMNRFHRMLRPGAFEFAGSRGGSCESEHSNHGLNMKYCQIYAPLPTVKKMLRKHPKNQHAFGGSGGNFATFLGNLRVESSPLGRCQPLHPNLTVGKRLGVFYGFRFPFGFPLKATAFLFSFRAPP